MPQKRVKSPEYYRMYVHTRALPAKQQRLTPFNEAKSWIKGLEYTAAGIPFVASPSVEYKRLKKKYGVGRLAKNQGEWIKQVEALRDPAVRQEEADLQRDLIAPLDVRYGAAKWDGMLASFV